MVSNINFAGISAGIIVTVLSGTARAGETAAYPELPTAASIYVHDLGPLKPSSFDPRDRLLAAIETDAGKFRADAAPATEFKPPLISGRKIHQYLGLSTVAFAGLTILAAPDDEEGAQTRPRQTSGTTHTRLARTTAALAAATVATGLIYHWNDIHWEDPFTDPDKLHARLAAAGALMMLYAVNKSAKSSVPTSHAGIAELGAVTMLVAIKLTW